MKRLTLLLAGVLAATALAAAPAQAAFGLSDFEVEFTKDESGSPAHQAGSHPFALTTFLALNFTGAGSTPIVDGKIRDALFEQVAGLTADVTAVPTCSTADFLLDRRSGAKCPSASVVGMHAPSFHNIEHFEAAGPVFFLPSPPGAAARLGLKVLDVPLVIDLGIKPEPDYNGVAASRGINQTLSVFGSIVELWGVPADPAHDLVRGHGCVGAVEVPDNLAAAIAGERLSRPDSGNECPANTPPAPFLILPRSCEGPAVTRYEVRSWQEPGVWVRGSDTDPEFSGCGILGFEPKMTSKPTSDSAETGTGLDFTLSFEHEGLKDPDGLAQSEIEKAVITLPEGVTVNPSIAEGLGVCKPDDLDDETLAAAPGEGCPNASKIGTVRVQSPLVDETVEGSVFLAEQDDPATSAPGAENPFDSLIAFYIVLKHRGLGILVKQASKVEPDPRTGQLVTTVEDIPQIPFSRFDFHFREGQRAPLITPATCGTYTTKAVLTPRANPSRPRTELDTFQITRGIGGGPCPPGGVPPFEPGFEAGALNNNAGSFSPFHMRITRRDGDQNLTKFSAVLPPGVIGRLAGVSWCADSQIARARAKTGKEELALPSCPPGSQIGQTQAGAGVGSALTYVPGELYLAGPYKGAPLSVVSITPAVAGPFDAGTVVVRVALRVDPRTAVVWADGSASDPIPHILKGIVLKVRDLRVHVDRPNFILNPTNCDPSATAATLFGSFLDVFSPADDLPVARSARYQVANCAALGFKPRLGLRLRGGTRRGAFPALRAVYRPRSGHANLRRLALRFPRSAFIEQGHFRTICTRVQYAANACPKGSIYGRARAFTPLLDQPLEGPVYLRSSNNNLPDAVFALKGIVDVEVVVRIDSARGGLRAIVAQAPDAPVSRVVVNMWGGQKGLFVNSRNLCRGKGKNRARVGLDAHNGTRRLLRPVVRPQCKKQRKARRSSHRRPAGH